MSKKFVSLDSVMNIDDIHEKSVRRILLALEREESARRI